MWDDQGHPNHIPNDDAPLVAKIEQPVTDWQVAIAFSAFAIVVMYVLHCVLSYCLSAAIIASCIDAHMNVQLVFDSVQCVRP